MQTLIMRESLRPLQVCSRHSHVKLQLFHPLRSIVLSFSDAASPPPSPSSHLPPALSILLFPRATCLALMGKSDFEAVSVSVHTGPHACVSLGVSVHLSRGGRSTLSFYIIENSDASVHKLSVTCKSPTVTISVLKN